jgi:L-ascorbate metabolism protein UlaG (beta-lactamase superfamily)
MELTHFGHSCLLANFEGDSGHETTILFDPGNFSHGFEGITGLSAILITHQHPDHADTERLPALMEANPQAALYADPQTAEQLGGPWKAARRRRVQHRAPDRAVSAAARGDPRNSRRPFRISSVTARMRRG